MRINRIEERMDDNSSLSHQNGSGGPIGGGILSAQLAGIQQQQQLGQNQTNIINKTGDDGNGSAPSNTQYSIPGILHFLQHEWARFELERSQWDVDRAELQVKYSYFKNYSLKKNLNIHR